MGRRELDRKRAFQSSREAWQEMMSFYLKMNYEGLSENDQLGGGGGGGDPQQ